MEKVKLTKAQENELRKALDDYQEHTLVNMYVRDVLNKEYLKNLVKLTLDDFIKALYIGYEVEQTPEEKIKELYDNHCHQGFKDQYANGVLDTIKIMLKHLNIKIEGVND